MKLAQLAAKPQLVKITIDDPEITQRFSNSEPIEFYTWDRQPLSQFMSLAALDTTDTVSLLNAVRTMILDDTGQEIITEENVLPGPVLMTAMAKITETLGK